MRSRSLILTLGRLLFIGSVISACLPVNPTPALPEYQVAGTLTAQPSPSPTVLPDRSDELSCTQDSDCVLAYRTDQCCDCWSIYNRTTLDENRHLRLVDEPAGYKYAKWRCPQIPCPFVACAPCFNPPYGLVCDDLICRGAETWQEIMHACEALPQDKQSYCYGNAAVTAYQNEGEEKAAGICTSLNGIETWGTPFSADCLLQVARLIMANDPQRSMLFCRSYMTTLQSNCLNESAYAIGSTDMEAGLAVCSEITGDSANDIQQKEFCFHNLAMTVAKADLARARQICAMMSGEVERCELDAEEEVTR